MTALAGTSLSTVGTFVPFMGEDDEPAYGTDGMNDEDGQYGGTEDDGDGKKSAGGEDPDGEDGDEEEFRQDETDPEQSR